MVPVNSKDRFSKTLSQGVPIYGPVFLPPSYLEQTKRQSAPEITPDVMYLKPLTIIHPFYFSDLFHCPNQPLDTPDGHKVSWDGWSSMGPREVHGLEREETALGFQLRCHACPARSPTGDKLQHCWALTSSQFWQQREHYDIPRVIPLFFRRCAVSRQLFNFLIEFRPSLTASGIEEHIHRQCSCSLKWQQD